jgi:hypothetical protein
MDGSMSTPGHEAMPKRGTLTSEKHGGPADLFDPASYPVRAKCQHCGGDLRTERFSAPFTHLPASPPPGFPATTQLPAATAGHDKKEGTSRAQVH